VQSDKVRPFFLAFQDVVLGYFIKPWATAICAHHPMINRDHYDLRHLRRAVRRAERVEWAAGPASHEILKSN
jgi:hypothetical protein